MAFSLTSLGMFLDTEIECLHQNGTGNDVHRLTVPQVRILPSIGTEYIPESVDTLVGLVRLILWQGSENTKVNYLSSRLKKENGTSCNANLTCSSLFQSPPMTRTFSLHYPSKVGYIPQGSWIEGRVTHCKPPRFRLEVCLGVPLE